MFLLASWVHKESLNSAQRFRGREIGDWSPTSNVIHEIGSSLLMLVLLINFKEKDSSSNSKVNIAPGGVHVPTIR